MARRPGHKQEDDIFSLRREMWLLWRERIVGFLSRRVTRTRKQMVERERAHPDAALFYEPAARDITGRFVMTITASFLHIGASFWVSPPFGCLFFSPTFFCLIVVFNRQKNVG